MDHLRHAPETQHQHPVETPESGGPVPGSFKDVRVKQNDGSAPELPAHVPLDLTKGITTRLRVFREQPKQSDPYVTYQVVPDLPPLAPKTPDQSPPNDPLVLKHFYIGTITVNLPDGKKFKSLLVSEGSGADSLRVDLTKGVDVACSLDYTTLTSLPVGPMLNIVVTPAAP
jgi:hypothetical protein